MSLFRWSVELPLSSLRSRSKKYLQGERLLMLPDNWKSVAVWTTVVIVIIVTIGLIYNP